MKAELLEHTDTEWVRTVRIVYDNKSYKVRILWSEFDGYQMLPGVYKSDLYGWRDLPKTLRIQYDNVYEFISDLEYWQPLKETVNV